MDAPITMELDEAELRITPWRHDSPMALLTPMRCPERLNVAAIDRAVTAAADHGYAGVYSSALGAFESEIFAQAGFDLERQLHLLLLDVARWQRKEQHRTDQSRLRRLVPYLRQTRLARSGEYTELLTVDRAAFDSFWRFDPAALRDAIAATPTARVAVNTSNGLAGFHITGRAGDQGYIQRLAVHPQRQGAGIGRSLLVDALVWLQRNRVRAAHVNTQLDNERALHLYESEGFVNQPDRLSVFVMHFKDKVPDTPVPGR